MNTRNGLINNSLKNHKVCHKATTCIKYQFYLYCKFFGLAFCKIDLSNENQEEINELFNFYNNLSQKLKLDEK